MYKGLITKLLLQHLFSSPSSSPFCNFLFLNFSTACSFETFLCPFSNIPMMAPQNKNFQRPPFRAEHLGSLLRPQVLVDKRVALDGQKAVVIANDKELHTLEDQAIDDIVKLQLDLGYHAVNDGEYRRHQFWGTFFPALEGMEEIENPPLEMFRLYVPDLAAFSMCCCSSRNRVTQPND